MAKTVTRDQLERAWRIAGCRMTLDDALANPMLSRLLHLGAAAMAESRPVRQRAQPNPMPAWAKHLQKLAGTIDHQRLRAGDHD